MVPAARRPLPCIGTVPGFRSFPHEAEVGPSSGPDADDARGISMYSGI